MEEKEHKEKNLTYTIFHDYGVIDEKNNQYIAMRKLQWHPTDKDPDESKAKIEIRRWTVDTEKSDGKDIPGKGVTFLSPQGPDNLADLLVKEGYGHTRDIVTSIKNRDDIHKVLDELKNGSKDDDSDDEFFEEMSSILE